MVILWTDALIYLLLAMSLLLALSVRGKTHLRRPWQKITSNRTGMVACVFLLFFMVIGLIDSIHYKPENSGNNEIISLLDNLANHLREHPEKTYSAPFATHLYSKERIIGADGSVSWAYPRLQYGGVHLQHSQQKYRDIFSKAVTGFVKGAGLSGFFIVLLWSFYKQRHHRLFASSSAKWAWASVFLLLSGGYALIELSFYYHVFGTDKVGEDVFYQSLKSIRTGLVIGTLTTLIMLPLAIVFGILAGFFRGWVDDVIQYLYTTLNSIPGVLLIAASILMVQVYIANHEQAFTNVTLRADIRLLFLCMILGVTSWTGLCRLLRAETLKLREMEYVMAAQALGVRQVHILLRHILPNVMHIIMISVALDFSSLVLAEAVLSYINIGVDPTTYSWGNMINGARLEMAREPIVWWSLAAAFLFMFSLVLAANLFADAIRDAFDPRSVDRA